MTNVPKQFLKCHIQSNLSAPFSIQLCKKIQIKSRQSNFLKVSTAMTFDLLIDQHQDFEFTVTFVTILKAYNLS